MGEKFKSEVSELIHESAIALLDVGAISKATMREFDESCLAAISDAARRQSDADTEHGTEP
ncbi:MULTISPECIES: DNA-binding protein [Pseudomonas]|uniref:DNA-binding protein n=1 Tax=Pseudomonas TaxID=286 RepID=UPI0011311B83|nr:DNA-binding protein [Pseudomonas fluorescens]TMU80951.1 DNA-binding protein [Pseudomonas fluorescens]